MSDRQRVVVVTGGGGGIGAAIAESASRTGAFVVTVDPLVSVDGSAQVAADPEATTTAGRIIAAGGHARASALSVTDAAGIATLFTELADEFGGLDAVVNVAGISRPTTFAGGSEQDWQSVLSVHLDGYRNVLAAALPLMAAAGRGHILGVTSGSGWRGTDDGAYGCAKRAVAAVTWQLGRHAPKGVVINAISPVAATRMVAEALSRRRTTSGGLSLGSMPTPDQLGPLGAHLVDDDFTACVGRVLFTAGAEVAVIDEPRLLEVVRLDEVTSPAHVLETALSKALIPAQSGQATGGGGNARFGAAFDEPGPGPAPVAACRSCAIATDQPEVAAALVTALESRGVTARAIDEPAQLAELADVDGVVVALAGPDQPRDGEPWARMLATHSDLVERLLLDASWLRGVAKCAAHAGRPIRLVTIVDARESGGRSRAQAVAQLSRSGRKATGDTLLPYVISSESEAASAELAAHLVSSPAAAELAGAELVSGAGWFGVRSHPRPVGGISFGGPSVPAWFDDVLRELVPS